MSLQTTTLSYECRTFCLGHSSLRGLPLWPEGVHKAVYVPRKPFAGRPGDSCVSWIRPMSVPYFHCLARYLRHSNSQLCLLLTMVLFRQRTMGTIPRRSLCSHQGKRAPQIVVNRRKSFCISRKPGAYHERDKYGVLILCTNLRGMCRVCAVYVRGVCGMHTPVFLMLQAQQPSRLRIREVWAFDWQNHGESYVLNKDIIKDDVNAARG